MTSPQQEVQNKSNSNLLKSVFKLTEASKVRNIKQNLGDLNNQEILYENNNNSNNNPFLKTENSNITTTKKPKMLKIVEEKTSNVNKEMKVPINNTNTNDNDNSNKNNNSKIQTERYPDRKLSTVSVEGFPYKTLSSHSSFDIVRRKSTTKFNRLNSNLNNNSNNQSYFIYKLNNLKIYKQQKVKLLNHMLKRETKFSDLEKIEFFNKENNYSLALTKNKQHEIIEKKKLLLDSLQLEIEQELADSYTLRSEMASLKNKYISPKEQILELINFKQHAFRCYFSIKNRLEEDKAILLKSLEDEFTLAKLNEEQYEKYIIIKENSFRTFELQFKLLKEMRIYESMFSLELESEWQKRVKIFRKLEISVNHILKETDKNEKLLKYKRYEKDRISKKLKRKQKQNNKIKDEVEKQFKKNLEKKCLLEKIFHYLKVDNVESSLKKILTQTIAFNSCFNYFNTKNKEITNVNNENTKKEKELKDITKELLVETKIEVSEIKEDAVLDPFNIKDFSKLELLKQLNFNMIRKISDKEKTIVALISFYKKYNREIKIIHHFYFCELTLKNRRVHTITNPYFYSSSLIISNSLLSKKLDDVYLLPKENYCIKDLFVLLGYTQAFIRKLEFLYYNDLALVSKERNNDTHIINIVDNIENNNVIRNNSNNANENDINDINDLNYNDEMLNTHTNTNNLNSLDNNNHHNDDNDHSYYKYSDGDLTVYNNNYVKKEVEIISLTKEDNIIEQARRIKEKKDIVSKKARIIPNRNFINNNKDKKPENKADKIIDEPNTNLPKADDLLNSYIKIKQKAIDIKKQREQTMLNHLQSKNNISYNSNNVSTIHKQERDFRQTVAFKSKLEREIAKYANNLVQTNYLATKNKKIYNINNINSNINGNEFNNYYNFDNNYLVTETSNNSKRVNIKDEASVKSKTLSNFFFKYSNAENASISNKIKKKNLNMSKSRSKMNLNNKRKKNNTNSFDNLKMLIKRKNSDDSFDENNQVAFPEPSNENTSKWFYGKNLPEFRTEETKKMYHRISDLQNLNTNLFTQGTKEGEFKVDSDFNRIYTQFKKKQ